MLFFKKIVPVLGLLLLIVLVSNCAKVGTISGGPKDLDPPVMVGSEPEQFATNFKEKKIRMNFNEYVQLKDFNQQFNVSPPLKKKPKVWINNRSVFIQYTDTLMDSTTYTMNFGNSLVDNNEGNILENFEFVFSNTSYIDSMGVQGYVIDAFTGKPGKEPFLVCLYTNLADSAPRKIKPTFTGRTYKDGIFRINNVKAGNYRLYAFQDKNNNYKYDAVTEAFAFADTIVVLTPEFLQNIVPPVVKPDTFVSKKDTSANRKDSVKVKRLEYDKNKLMVELYSFSEKDKKQFIKDFGWKEKRNFYTSFNKPLINDESSITPMYLDIKDWCKIEIGPNRDSLIYWITDTNVLKTDTLRCILSFLDVKDKTDTSLISDTIKFMYTKTETPKKKKDKDTIIEKMIIKTNVESMLDLNSNITIELGFPIENINADKIVLLERVDTLDVSRKFQLVQDSVYPRKYHLKYKWIEQTTFKIFIYPGSFTNIYGIPHDTVKLNFSTQKLEFYGKQSINISENDGKKLIVQLLDKELPKYEKTISGNGTLDFEFLRPGTYTLKAIYDENGDKKYTTGDFSERKQAERVTVNKDPIVVRSNWESTLEWAPKFNTDN